MPTVLRWGPFRAFFYSSEGASLRIFTFAQGTRKRNFGFMICRLPLMRDFLHTNSVISFAT